MGNKTRCFKDYCQCKGALKVLADWEFRGEGPRAGGEGAVVPNCSVKRRGFCS